MNNSHIYYNQLVAKLVLDSSSLVIWLNILSITVTILFTFIDKFGG